MSKARKIADMAIFTALGAVLNMMSFSSYGMFGRMSLVYAFCYIVGILYGPLLGASIAIMADLIPALILPQGPFNIVINLGAGIMALIMGLCSRIKGGGFMWKFVLGALLSFIIVTLGVNVLGETMRINGASLFDMFPYTLAKTLGATLNIKSPYLMLAMAKLIQQPIWIIMNSAIVYLILYRLRNVISFRYNLNLFEKRKDIVLEEQ